MATVTSSDLVAVQSLAKQVATLRPSTADEIALVAFMAGALYSLNRAIQCRFDDARMMPDLASLRSELAGVLERLALSQEPRRPYLSGYYIDSAMMRIAALGERLSKRVGAPRPLASHVADAVNSMKHDIDAGIGVGWEARFKDVLKAAEDLWPLLAKAVPSSASASV
jgi:hypothetical protein